MREMGLDIYVPSWEERKKVDRFRQQLAPIFLGIFLRPVVLAFLSLLLYCYRALPRFRGFGRGPAPIAVDRAQKP